MKKIMRSFIWMAIGVVVMSVQARACDYCGCAMGGNYSGVFPQFHKNVLGLRYQHRDFRHPNTLLNRNGDRQVLADEFRNYELWGRFYPHPRVQFFAFVPVRRNTRVEENGSQTTIQGVGDLSFFANYAMVNNTDSTGKLLRHALLVGGGVKLPTGKYQQRDANRVALPAQFQVGTGAYGFVVSLNYTLRYKKWGLNTDVLHRFHTTNEWAYQFGAQSAAVAHVFYWINRDGATILPSLGLSYERYGMDIEHDRSKIETGGSIGLVNAGVDIYLDRFFVQASIQNPILQQLPYAQPEAEPRFNIGVAWTF